MINTNKLLTRIWCWIIGHNIICLKRHTQIREDWGTPYTTVSAHQCLRCKERWVEQWDE